jgi:exocyst complex component 4
VSDFRSFLDDFILNVLLPKVEDEILEYFHELINGMYGAVSATAVKVLIPPSCSGEDAFSAQRDERLSPFPLLNVSFREQGCSVIRLT